MFKTISDPADCEVCSVIPRGETINAEGYCETLRKLRRAVQNKRHGMLSEGIVLIHGNTCTYYAGVTQNLIQELVGSSLTIRHTALILHFLMSNCFLHLKWDNAEDGVRQWLSSMVASFYEEGIEKLVSRNNK